MKWTFVPFEERHGQQVCAWRYPAPYDIYNWTPWEQLLERAEEFADEAVRAEQYEAVLDADGRLCGFVQFFPIVGWTRLGFGMRPDLCGQGLGPDFVQAVTARAQERQPENRIDLEVLTFNERAIRAYRKAGFEITDTYVRNTPTGPDEFHCMVYHASCRG